MVCSAGPIAFIPLESDPEEAEIAGTEIGPNDRRQVLSGDHARSHAHATLDPLALSLRTGKDGRGENMLAASRVL
jgi:hypothetical protein